MTYSSRHCSSHTIPLKQQSSTKPSLRYNFYCYSTNIIELKGPLNPQKHTLQKLRITIYGSIKIFGSNVKAQN